MTAHGCVLLLHPPVGTLWEECKVESYYDRLLVPNEAEKHILQVQARSNHYIVRVQLDRCCDERNIAFKPSMEQCGPCIHAHYSNKQGTLDVGSP